MDPLAEVRSKINAIDEQLVALIEERMACAREVGRIKQVHQKAVYDVLRENFIFKRLAARSSFKGEELKILLGEIISLCRKEQKTIGVNLFKSQSSAREALRYLLGSFVEVSRASSLEELDLKKNYLFFSLRHVDEALFSHLLKSSPYVPYFSFRFEEEDFLFLSQENHESQKNLENEPDAHHQTFLYFVQSEALFSPTNTLFPLMDNPKKALSFSPTLSILREMPIHVL